MTASQQRLVALHYPRHADKVVCAQYRATGRCRLFDRTGFCMFDHPPFARLLQVHLDTGAPTQSPFRNSGLMPSILELTRRDTSGNMLMESPAATPPPPSMLQTDNSEPDSVAQAASAAAASGDEAAATAATATPPASPKRIALRTAERTASGTSAYTTISVTSVSSSMVGGGSVGGDCSSPRRHLPRARGRRLQLGRGGGGLGVVSGPAPYPPHEFAAELEASLQPLVLPHCHVPVTQAGRSLYGVHAGDDGVLAASASPASPSSKAGATAKLPTQPLALEHAGSSSGGGGPVPLRGGDDDSVARACYGGYARPLHPHRYSLSAVAAQRVFTHGVPAAACTHTSTTAQSQRPPSEGAMVCGSECATSRGIRAACLGFFAGALAGFRDALFFPRVDEPPIFNGTAFQTHTLSGAMARGDDQRARGRDWFRWEDADSRFYTRLFATEVKTSCMVCCCHYGPPDSTTPPSLS